jgi:hypothetical protein
MRLANTLLCTITAAALGTACSALAQIDPFSYDMRPPVGEYEPQEEPTRCPAGGCEPPEGASGEISGGEAAVEDEDGSSQQIRPRIHTESPGNKYGIVGHRHMKCHRGLCSP